MLTKFKNLSHILRGLIPPSPLIAACLLIYAASVLCFTWALLKQNWRLVFASLASITIAVSVVMKITVFFAAQHTGYTMKLLCRGSKKK